MAIEDRFYPWTQEDFHRQVFSEGEAVLVQEESYPFGRGNFSVHEGIITGVNKVRGTDLYWYHVTVASPPSGGDIPLRRLRPYLGDEGLRIILCRNLEETYTSLRERVAELDRDKICKYFVLLDRIQQELKAKK